MRHGHLYLPSHQQGRFHLGAEHRGELVRRVFSIGVRPRRGTLQKAPLFGSPS